jgi:hypothetical protein
MDPPLIIARSRNITITDASLARPKKRSENADMQLRGTSSSAKIQQQHHLRFQKPGIARI